jgi:hypothetical protein
VGRGKDPVGLDTASTFPIRAHDTSMFNSTSDLDCYERGYDGTKELQ